jgi:type II secretion system protein G
MTFFNKKEKKGFTIGEMLLLLIVIGILISLVVPLFLFTKEKATQRSTMVDMQMWAEAIACYIADHSVAPTNPRGIMNYKKPIVKELSPYLKAIRILDWWGYPFQIWTGKGVHQYGITTKTEKEFIIASLGRKGVMDGWKYFPTNLSSGFFEIKKLKDFENDLILWNNKFIRCPR